MRFKARYLILILILIAALGAVVWAVFTYPRAKKLFFPAGAEENNTSDQEAADASNADIKASQEAADASENAKDENDPSGSNASGISVKPEIADDEAEDADDPDHQEGDPAAESDEEQSSWEGGIVEQDGDLVIIVPDGEDTFGE